MPSKPGHLTPDRARELAALRKRKAGGRPPVLRPCPKCGVPIPARALWRGHGC